MVCVIFRFYAYISFLPSPTLTAFRLNCWMFRNELKLLAWVVQEQSIWNDGARSVLFVEMKGLLEREKKIKSTSPPVADKPLNSFDAMYKYKAHEIEGFPSFQLLKLHVFVNLCGKECGAMRSSLTFTFKMFLVQHSLKSTMDFWYKFTQPQTFPSVYFVCWLEIKSWHK